MQYRTNSGIWGSVFAVPATVVDDHLKLAGSVQLKALLWVLRQGGAAFTDDALSQALGVSTADARDALGYWQATGVLQFAADTAKAVPAGSPSQAVVPPAQPVAAEAPPVVAPRPARHAPLPRAERPDPVFINQRMEEDNSLHCMVLDAEQILARTLSPSDIGGLLMIHDNYGLPVDVVLMLVQYASDVGHGNMRYIEKVAMNWADEGIITHELAENKLQQLTDLNRAWRTVQNILGLPRRAPTEREKGCAANWVLQWNFSDTMLKLAYDRCVNATGTFRSSYMNKILERWHRERLSTAEQVEAQDQKRQETRKEAEKPSFDLDAYERDSMFDVTGGNH